MTMFGICWGVASTIVLMGVGAGVERGVRKTWEDLGKNIIVVWPGTISRQSDSGARAGKAVKLTIADAELIGRSPLVRKVSPEFASTESLQIQRGRREARAPVHGVTPIYGKMRSIRLEEGRFLNQWDIEDKRAVCVLGATVKKRLYGSGAAVGSWVRLAGRDFLVVGTAVEKPFLGPTYSGPDDLKVFLPYPQASSLLDTEYLSNLIAEPVSPLNATETTDAIVTILAAKHGFSFDDPDALTVWNTAGTAMRTIRLFSIVKILLLLTGAVTLGIGGVGVMNIMLISVKERTREIGLLKALGAKKRHILGQFLLESLVMTGLAGPIGIAVGSGICLAGLAVKGAFASYMPVLHSSSILISVGVLAFVSIVAGFYPAAKAAGLHPIEALRYE